MAQVVLTTRNGVHPATCVDPKTGETPSVEECERIAAAANEKAKALGIKERYEVRA